MNKNTVHVNIPQQSDSTALFLLIILQELMDMVLNSFYLSFS